MQAKAFAWLGLCLLFAVPAHADGVMQRAQARGSLVVAAAPFPEQLPQSARDESRGYTGFDVDVANEIGKRLGLPVRFVSPGWSRVLAGDWRGEWDFAVASITPTPEREQKLVFPAVYRFDVAALVVPKNNTSIQRPADAAGKTIGVRQGTTFEDYLRRNLILYNSPSAVTYLIDNPKIRTFPDREQMVKALTDGKVDAVVTSLGLAEHDIAEGAPLRVVHGFLFFEPVAVAVDKGDPDFPTKIGEAVRAMRADGTLTNLSEKWFGIDVAGIVP
jgi:polar amino acid transport system substrate-binding protein